MSALEYILDGLEAALELERELGVRAVEIDRGVLASTVGGEGGKVEEVEKVEKIEKIDKVDKRLLDLVFLHDRALSPKGVEMMAKIITALGRTAENSPIVIASPVPAAKVVVVLGGLALKKYFPGIKGEPGQWQKTPDGREVLITYSPEYILRFATVTPAVERIKKDMWRSLKAVKQRLE